MTPRWKIRRTVDPNDSRFRVWQVYDRGHGKGYFYIWENALTWIGIWESDESA